MNGLIDENSTQEEVVKAAWISKVHVDEEGYFSDCPEFCDDCFWYDYFDVHLTPKIEEVKKLCETFRVSSHSGKIYTYYSPNPDAIKYLVENCSENIEQARNKLIEDERSRREAKERARIEAEETVRREKEEDERHSKELNELLITELGEGYVRTSEGTMQKGEFLKSFIPKKKYAYPTWTAYKWADGKGIVVSHEHNHDFWQTYLYTSPDEVDKIQNQAVCDAIENPSDYLIVTIAYYQTGGQQGSDYSECYNSEHYKTIAKNEKLSAETIKNFTSRMLNTELSEQDKEHPYSFRDYWVNSEKPACEWLGIKEQAEAARSARKQKVEDIKVALKKQEEEAKQKEIEEAQKKFAVINPSLKVVSVFMHTATIKIESGMKRTPKKVFDEAVQACNALKGTYNKRDKTWQIKIPE